MVIVCIILFEGKSILINQREKIKNKTKLPLRHELGKKYTDLMDKLIAASSKLKLGD